MGAVKQLRRCEVCGEYVRVPLAWHSVVVCAECVETIKERSK